MADTIKTTNELKLDCAFADGDTRLISLENPKPNLTAADILGVETFMKNNNPIIGDKGGADFSGFNSAETVQKTITTLDLA